MLTLANTPPTVRVISQPDVRKILRMVDSAWRVYIRMAPVELRAKIEALPGFLAEDSAGLRGFMVIEPIGPNVALLVAAGLRDTWSVRLYLDLLLPEIERDAHTRQLSSLVYIGNAQWLIDELTQRRFETHEWMMAYERSGVDPPPEVSAPATIRTAHTRDLSVLLGLDALAFDQIWRKSLGNFNRALASAASFVLAELDGEIVGYAWCELIRQHAHLTRLAVHPGYQGRGIGAQLLQRAINDVLARGGNRITLNTQENNWRSRTLYERFGFVDTEQRMPVLWKTLD